MNNNWFADKHNELKKKPSYIAELKVIEFIEQVIVKMEENNISRSDLAKMIGVSKARITNILNCNPNMTMKTMVQIAYYLNCDISFDVFPKEYRKYSLFVSPENFTKKNSTVISKEVNYECAA